MRYLQWSISQHLQQNTDATSPSDQLDVDQHCIENRISVRITAPVCSLISAKVWTQMDLKGSSGCSAIAMNARIMGSERGTFPEQGAVFGPLLCDPISTTARMNLITCSFSTVCLLSKVRDLENAVNFNEQVYETQTYLTMYQSRGCSFRH